MRLTKVIVVIASISCGMSFAHYTDNPTDFIEQTLDGNQVTVDNWSNPSPYSSLMSPFDYLGGQPSLTGYEHNAQLDDKTSNNFASVEGDSGMISIGSSSSTCLVTEYVAPTIPVTDSLNRAPRYWLRRQEHKRRFSEGEGWSSRERKIVHITHTKVTMPFISSNTFSRNKWLSNSGKQNDNSVLKPQELQLRPPQ